MDPGAPQPMTLARFQDAFAAALSPRDAPADDRRALDRDIARVVDQPGFAVYCNTVAKGIIDALLANYPAVARLVGEAWFRAAAAAFVRASPPRHPALLDYGAGFDAFLERFEPARALTYLPGVARVERFWTEAHIARDEQPVAAGAVARLDLEQLGRASLRPHTSARWAWFDAQPIASIWERNRSPGGASADVHAGLEWRGEGVLVVRPHGEVRSMALDQAGCAFLDACAAGNTLAAAAAAALAADPGADLSALLERTLDAGAYGQLVLASAECEETR